LEGPEVKIEQAKMLFVDYLLEALASVRQTGTKVPYNSNGQKHFRFFNFRQIFLKKRRSDS